MEKKKPFCNYNDVKTGGLWHRVQVFVLLVHTRRHTQARRHMVYILQLSIRQVKHKTESSIRSLANPCISVCSYQVSVTNCHSSW